MHRFEAMERIDSKWNINISCEKKKEKKRDYENSNEYNFIIYNLASRFNDLRSTKFMKFINDLCGSLFVSNKFFNGWRIFSFVSYYRFEERKIPFTFISSDMLRKFLINNFIA